MSRVARGRRITEMTEAISALRRSGWRVGDTAFAKPPGVSCCVYRTRGDHNVRTEGRTRDEAGSGKTFLAKIVEAAPPAAVNSLINPFAAEAPEVSIWERS